MASLGNNELTLLDGTNHNICPRDANYVESTLHKPLCVSSVRRSINMHCNLVCSTVIIKMSLKNGPDYVSGSLVFDRTPIYFPAQIITSREVSDFLLLLRIGCTAKDDVLKLITPKFQGYLVSYYGIEALWLLVVLLGSLTDFAPTKAVFVRNIRRSFACASGSNTAVRKVIEI